MFKFLTESIKAFRNRGIESYSPKAIEARSGEGREELYVPHTISTLSSFNLFYKNFINKDYENELAKIKSYREMASMPEIADIIDDIVVEATQENEDGEIFTLDIFDPDLENNKNAKDNIYDEFNNLFYNRIDISKKLSSFIETFVIDGRIFYERIIHKGRSSEGIINIKKLPTETMDFDYDPKTGKIKYFFQYLSESRKTPISIEEAEKDKDIIVFYPEQIGYLDYGIYGKNKKDIRGYLDKVKVPFNQLKLLETSIVIYRIIRAPERLIHKIDVGSMPQDKALRYVEKIKNSMSMKQAYDSATGRLTNEPALLSLLHNYFLPQCLSLDTKIRVVPWNNENPIQNFDLPLWKIIEDFNNGKKYEVYSYCQNTGQILIGQIEWAGITRKNAELIRVHLDTGEFIDCTPDHKFVLMDGTEVEAQNLTFEMPLSKIFNMFVKRAVKIEKLENKEDTGCITVFDAGRNHNFALDCGVFVKNSADGRGSDITSISGNFEALKTLDDLYYFQKKLYRSLRYPISRVQSRHERQEEPMFGGRTMAEISRDEIKWAKFLERKVQNPFEKELLNLFLLHLEFTGLKKEYGLNKDKLTIKFNDPSFYKSQQQQMFIETRAENYLRLAHSEEFSKYFLMKKYLDWSDEEIEENAEYMNKDYELGFKKKEREDNF